MGVSIADVNIEDDLQQQVEVVSANGAAVRIVGGNSKAFYGNRVEGLDINVGPHSGIIDYDPAELVITLRAGCKIHEVEALLAEKNQMFGFEPLDFGPQATIGGMVASGLCGPRRAYSGAIRDFILGIRLLNGKGEIVNFGGRVIKNVAGFDISRLMAGALGTLGILLQLSLRVLPRFETEVTLQFEHASAQSHIDWVNQLAALPLPLSGSVWHNGESLLRISGSELGVKSAIRQIGGTQLGSEHAVWSQLRSQSHEFFRRSPDIARVSVPATEADFLGRDEQLIEWGGAQRWIGRHKDLDNLRKVTKNHRALVCAYRGYHDIRERFHPPVDSIMTMHRNIKSSFDPAAIFNHGRLYADL